MQDESAEKTYHQTIATVIRGIRTDQPRPIWDKLKARWMAEDVKPEGGDTTKQE